MSNTLIVASGLGSESPRTLGFLFRVVRAGGRVGFRNGCLGDPSLGAIGILDPAGMVRFFETVLRCIADGAFTNGPDRRTTSFNRAADRITGIPVVRPIGRGCSQVFHTDPSEQRRPRPWIIAPWP